MSASEATPNEALLRAAHSSLCITWGTTGPYRIQRVRCEKVGFAQLPMIVVDAFAPENMVDALVPIIRQHVFRELAERGWDNEHCSFVPSVRIGRLRKFLDDNESSDSYGRNKMGLELTYSFDMSRELAKTTFPIGQGSYGRLPERGAS